MSDKGGPYSNKAPWKHDNDSDIMADHDYWSEFADALGWRLYGWSFRVSASFIDQQDRMLNITGHQRDVIISKIKNEV